jgi:hypothetical protein
MPDGVRDFARRRPGITSRTSAATGLLPPNPHRNIPRSSWLLQPPREPKQDAHRFASLNLNARVLDASRVA